MSGRVGSITTEIITDGLVFNMDAANRASTIPSSATTKAFNTINLSQTGSLQDTGMFSADNKGVFVCDGVDTGIALSSTSNLGTISTVGIWVKRNDPTDNVKALFGNNANAWQPAWYIGSTTSFTVSLSKWVKPTFYSSGWSNTTDWFYITITRNGDAANLYKNGAFIDDLTGLGTGETKFDSIGFQSADNSDYYNGNIGPVHMYNRILSTSEILHNYNALKGRFGLS
jgi:hypothetical protein